ncbi:MarR family winged helix-turn-helix transcriptional regulator [Inquilinus limosus]|uniref:MarR family winged helix-turn-helix transcriptional regulator n=1 Tax=Inquilinus limosus TaxID=171674 RepID=UPI000479FD5A|nr:MarR family winged helix-turn-helix transcriptional regulator [Inquilinus limosus]
MNNLRALQKLMRVADELQRIHPSMTVACADVFLTIAYLGEPSSVEIAAAVNTSRSTAYRYIQELGVVRGWKVVKGIREPIPGHGLIEQHTDPLDRRTVRLRLTPKGRDLMNLLVRIINS